MTEPEQHSPPVYACAAGSVGHTHPGGGLEPAVLLHTFLPPGADLHGPARVDVHADGPGSPTLTVRVLVEGHALSWRLPVAPFVAALPGQLGEDGRRVLLAVVDSEPPAAFWAQPVDCEQLAGELDLPVADLAEALRGRLIPWLADDLAHLLHDDDHERAVSQSPAQTVATAVLDAYRGDLAAAQSATRLVRALELAPEEVVVELGSRLAAGLAEAVSLADDAAVAAVRERTGPFESEVLRLIDQLPGQLRAATPGVRVERTVEVLLEGSEREESVRAAVALTAALARETVGADRPAQQVLRALAMVDDEGQARLARLWVALAVAAAGPPEGDAAAVPHLLELIAAEGPPGDRWLRQTAQALTGLTQQAVARPPQRVVGPLALLAQERPDRPVPGEELAACLSLARFLRQRAGLGPGGWLVVPELVAAQGVGVALAQGLDVSFAVDLLEEVMEDDVEGADVLDALVCASTHLLAELDPGVATELRQIQTAELLSGASPGPKGFRWLLAAILRLAPDHDPGALDLRPVLPADIADPEQLASRAGRSGMLRLGLACLRALGTTWGEEAQLPVEDLLAEALPAALDEHDLLRRPDLD